MSKEKPPRLPTQHDYEVVLNILRHYDTESDMEIRSLDRVQPVLEGLARWNGEKEAKVAALPNRRDRDRQMGKP